MRSDYGLYGVMVTCFVVSAVFAGSLVPGYRLTGDNSAAGISVTVIFVLVGIIAGVLGYSVRPKALAPAAQPMQPTPMPPIAPAPQPEPEPPHLPPNPASPSSKLEEIAVEPPTASSTPPPQPEVVQPEQSTSSVETEPTAMKIEEEEKPKPARRRRKKTE